MAEYGKKRDTLQQVRALDTVGVKPGTVVGQVGAGVACFTLKIAGRVGPTGTFYANDIGGDFMRAIRDRAKERGVSNIETVLGTKTDPRLPQPETWREACPRGQRARQVPARRLPRGTHPPSLMYLHLTAK